MIKFSVSHTDAVVRITQVLEAITSSDEWRSRSHFLSRLGWHDAREPFRRFFDVYEGGNGTEWLGIMEDAVINQIQADGADLTVEPKAIDRIIARMAAHPNIELLG